MRIMALVATLVIGFIGGMMDIYYKTICVPGAQLSEQIARACIRHGYVYWSPLPNKKLFPPL